MLFTTESITTIFGDLYYGESTVIVGKRYFFFCFLSCFLMCNKNKLIIRQSPLYFILLLSTVKASS